MMDKTMVTMFGLFCLTVLECVALFNGINGTMFTMVVAIMAAGIGIVIPKDKIPVLKNYLK